MNVNSIMEERLLATHITNNKDFESACLSGDADKIMTIVHTEMEKHKLHTKGSIKLRDDILRKLQGKLMVSSYVGKNILAFVWNSRLSGTGFSVAK